MKVRMVVIPVDDQPYVKTVDTDETSTLHAFYGLIGVGCVDCIGLVGWLDMWVADAWWELPETANGVNVAAMRLLWGTRSEHRGARTAIRGTVVLAGNDVTGETIGLPLAIVDVLRDAGMSIRDEDEPSDDRERCLDCGEPCVLDDANDPQSWVHAFDAWDNADHGARTQAELDYLAAVNA